MPNVDVPNVGVVTFPDDMPETEINTAIENEYKRINVKKSIDASNPALPPPQSSDLRAAADYLRFGPRALGSAQDSRKPFVSEGGTRLDFPQNQIGLPTVTPPREAGTGEKIAAGVYNTGAGLINFPLSLEGYASMLGAELLPPPVTKAIFAGLLTKGAAEQAGKASVTHDPQDITEAALTALPVPFLARPGLPKAPPVAKLQGPPAPGEALRMPQGAPVPRGETAPAPAPETVDPITAAANALRMTREATGEDFVPTSKLRAPKAVVPVEDGQPAQLPLTKWQDFVAHLKENGTGQETLAQVKDMFKEQLPNMSDVQAVALAKNAFGPKWAAFGVKIPKGEAEPIAVRTNPPEPKETNAPEARNEPGSVQPERPGDDESGTQPEAGAGSSVPPEAPVSPPEAPGAAQVPPVAPDETVTLYRGDDGSGGSWFTSKPDKAASFGKRVRAVQVSKAEAEAAKAAAEKQGQGGDTYFLTRENADKAKAIEAPPAKVEAVDDSITLTPALHIGDNIITGKSHAQATTFGAGKGIDTVTREGRKEGFLGSDGKFYTRAEGAEIFKKQTGKDPSKPGELHSEDLAAEGMLDHVEKLQVTKAKAPESRDPTLHVDYSPDDLKKYLELKPKTMPKTIEEVNSPEFQKAWKEFEALRNKYNGNPPKQLLKPSEAATPPSDDSVQAEGMTLAEIKRKLPIGFDPDSVRIENGKIIATQKPLYGGREMVVSIKKATAEPVSEKGETKASEPGTTLPKPGTPEYDSLPAGAKITLGEHEINQRIIDTGMQPTGKKATKAQIAELVERQKQVLKNFEAAKVTTKPAEAPAAAAAKVEAQVEKVAATEGQRPAKEIKTELVSRLEKAISDAPAEADIKTVAYTTVKGRTVPAKDKATKVTIEIPGDGTFTIRNTKESLGDLLSRAKKVETSKGGAKPDKLPTGKKISEAGDVAKAYGGAENAYRSVKRQIEALDPNDPETSDKTSKATQLADSLYSLTKAGDAERKLTAAQRNVRIYEDGAEGFREKIAKIQSLKNPGNARLAELADLQKRYAENQKKLGEFKAIANEAEQTAAKEKAALEAPEPPKTTESKLSDALDQAATDALNRIRAREGGTTFGSGPLHELPNLKDYAIYGAAKLLKHGVRSAEWTKDMIEAFGPRIRAHLDKIFEASKNYLARYKAEQSNPGKPTSVQEIIAAATGAKPLQASSVTQAIDALQSGLQTARALKEHFTGQPKIPRADVKLADDFLEADANRIRESLNELVKNLLPPDERGRFLTAIANATKRSPILTGDPESMYRRAAQVAARIEDRAVDVRKNDAIDSLKETVARALQSPSVDIGYKRRIMQAMSDVSLTKPTQATLDALQRTKDYIDRQEALGNDVSMPREILDSLSLLTKVPLRDMPAEAVFALAQKIAQLEDMGRMKVAARQEVWDAEKSRRVGELSDENTTPLEQRPQLAHQPGESDSFSQRLGNVLNRMINSASFIDKALLPIDALFDFMGDGKGDYRGWLFRHVRGPLDLGFNEHLVLRDELAKPIETLIKKHNMGKREAERVNVYGLAHMPGGMERMIEQGITPETIERVIKTVSEPERDVYRAMRRAFDSQLPALQKLMHQLYNIEVKPVENYWPMPRDWEKQRVYQEAPAAKEPAFGEPMHYDELAGWKDMFADFFPGKTTATEKGMTIERKPEAKTPIKMNAFDVFWQHINDVTYLLKTQRDLKMIGEMVRTPEFEAKYGKVGQGMTLDFLDTFARQGRLGGLRRIPWLDTLRKNTSAGIIGFRVASQFVHASNVAFSLQRAGFDNYSAAVAELAGKPEAREWMERNFREALARGGGEPAISEASGKAPVGLSNYRKVARSSMAIARAIDKYNAEATMLGVYFKELKHLGGDPGNYLNEPINRDAQARAMVLARRAVASPLPKDVPMALSRGTLTGGNISMSRSLLQFQNIFLDQWSNIRHDLWRSGIVEGDPKKAAVLFLTVAGTVALETMIREGAAAGWQQVTGHKKKEESVPSKVIRETARRFPGGGQLTNLILHGETGIPSLDMLVETGSAAKTLVSTQNPRTAQRAAVKLLGGIGQIAGIPGSGEISQQALNAMRSSKE